MILLFCGFFDADFARNISCWRQRLNALRFTTRRNCSFPPMLFLWELMWIFRILELELGTDGALEICSYNDVTMIIENPNHASLASEQQLEDISPELVSVESYLWSYLVFYPVFSSSPIIQGVFFSLVCPKKWLSVRSHVNPLKKVLSVRISWGLALSHFWGGPVKTPPCKILDWDGSQEWY